MKPKKKKQKAAQQVSLADLLNLGEEHLLRGQIEVALDILLHADVVLRKESTRNSASGKKVSVPPHIVAARSKLPRLLARTLLARSLTRYDLQDKLADLNQASKLISDDPRYSLALGSTHLLSGDLSAACSEFQSAREKWPDDQIAERAFRLVSSAMKGETSIAESRAGHPSLLAGLDKLALGDLQAAAQILSEFPSLDHRPTRLEGASLATQLFYIGALKFGEKKWKAAASDFNEAARMAQTFRLNLPWRARLPAYYRGMAEAVWEEDSALAIHCWEAALLLEPGDGISAGNLARTRELLADRAWRSGKIEEAYTLWNQALAVNPSDERLLRKTAIACEKLGTKSEAIAHWRALAQVLRKQAKARRGEPGFTDRLLKLEEHVVALMLETESSGEEVCAELDAALKFDPENHELRIMLVEVLMELDKPRQALKQLEIIEKRQGVSVKLLVLKAETLDQLERSEDAWEVFELALELDPSSPLARRSFLIFLGEEAEKASEEEDYGLAMDICRRQLLLDPDYEPALCQLAALHMFEGEKDQGKELLARMLSADPQMAQKYVIAGGICLDAGLKKDAVKYFEKAIEMEPDVECYFNIGLDYWTAGYEKEGLKYFNKAAETAEAENLVQMAVALAQNGGSKESEPFLKKAIKLEPLNPITHIVRGMILTGLPDRFYPSRDDLKEARLEFDEAERLMIGREEYEAELHRLRDLKRKLEKIERTPLPFLGGMPFELLDDLLEGDEPSSESEFKPKTAWRRR